MLTIGKVLQNRFRIDRLIAEGGMGLVYEATDQQFPVTTKVAVKEARVFEEYHRLQFEYEASLLANLNHPALPHVKSLFTEDGKQFLVMDYIPAMI